MTNSTRLAEGFEKVEAPDQMDEEVLRRLPFWARLLLEFAEEATSAKTISVELEDELVKRFEAEHKGPCGNPGSLHWDRFLSVVLAVGVDELRKIDSEKALDLIAALEE